ncbi:DNA-directed RNA polymerase subunit D [Methanobacterium sp. ACI-7]|uniref:DNA-directed RNA polymerase subunit D n=1 Tax=unclassified Methanobacterium TaxID=2627676 RepID=UPI0039C19EB5
MDIDIREKNDNRITFVVDGVDISFINAIRRICTVEVPTMAIENVSIFKNDSAMFDEVLAQRLGLVPLETDIEAFELASECDCENNDCPSCSVSLVLKEKGPKVVYSGDLKSAHDAVKPVHDTIPLVKLKEGEEAELEATANLGIGLNHAKWQPAPTCAYKYYPLITIDENCEVCMKCAQDCPRNVIQYDDETNKIIITDIEKCSMCKTCIRGCDQDAVHIDAQENKYIFRIETDGSLSPEDVLENACDILKEKSEKIVAFCKGGSKK